MDPLTIAMLGLAGEFGHGDRNAFFPASDAKDLASGAPGIPGEVTYARRRGEKVSFDPARLEWTMADGAKVAW